MSENIHDEPHVPGEGDSSPNGAVAVPGVLRVYQTGPLTVVGFAGQDVPDEVCIAGYRDQLFKLIEEHHCTVLAFDLTGVVLVPSGMLGVLISLRKRLERVELYNPSKDVLEVLEMTKLISLFEIREVAV
ncbi:MAG: STAS domain-containing protein [Planctomycetaceae bacterium]|nr:STAS domain-containing protein [Planctomycetaceae bacterium]